MPRVLTLGRRIGSGNPARVRSAFDQPIDVAALNAIGGDSFVEGVMSIAECANRCLPVFVFLEQLV